MIEHSSLVSPLNLRLRTRRAPSAVQQLNLQLAKRLFGCVGSVAPAWSAIMAEQAFSTPECYRTSKVEQAFLQEGQRRTILSQGRKIRMWTWGSSGPLVLFVHGWAGRGCQYRMMIQHLVANGYTAVAFDQPAHGESEGQRTNLIEFALTTRDILHVLGHDVAAVVGHSLGAAAAVLALRGDEERRPALVLVNPVVDVRAEFDRFQALVGLPERPFRLMKHKIRERLGIAWPDLDLRTADWHSANGLSEVPALLFHDTRDGVRLSADRDDLHRHWPGSRLVTTFDLGHSRILSDSSVILEVGEFLRAALRE